jgi:hypothetical protein
MKPEDLLELQTALVTCLTDPSALSEFRSGAAAWKSLSFLDPDLMEIMSSFYRSKRLDKLTKVFPKTLAYLASEMGELIPEFMKRHAPVNADSYTNGCQFYGFLRRWWRTHPPNPPFLPDLAYCELARIGLELQAQPGGPAVLTIDSPLWRRPIMIRRRRGIRLYLSQYDIQPLFDPGWSDGADIPLQPVYIVLSRPLVSLSGKVYCVDQELFVLIRGLRNWTKVSLSGDLRHSEQSVALLGRLEELGFLEVQLCESE